MTELAVRSVGAVLRAGKVSSGPQAAAQVDMSMELLGVEALDSGRRRAVVVVDPQDPQALKGYLYLSGVYSESIEGAERETGRPRSGKVTRRVAERRTLQGLADKLSERTGLRAEVRDGVALDDPSLLQVPFLLLTVNSPVRYSEAEARNLGRYLTSGGFVYAESVTPFHWGQWYEEETDWPSFRELFREALSLVGKQEGRDWRFVRLAEDHPLFRCYYRIESLPRGFFDWPYVGASVARTSPEYLEGIEVGGEMVGIYSLKDYADFWAGEAERTREEDEMANLANGRFSIGGEELKVYDLGINIAVYALTREGSLAQKLVSVE